MWEIAWVVLHFHIMGTRVFCSLFLLLLSLVREGLAIASFLLLFLCERDLLTS